jgi:hypothetical protein
MLLGCTWAMAAESDRPGPTGPAVAPPGDAATTEVTVETPVIEQLPDAPKALVDLNKPIKVRVAEGVPGDRMANGNHRVLGTGITLSSKSGAEVLLPYWLARRLAQDDVARLNEIQRQVWQRIQTTTAGWRACKSKIVEADRQFDAALRARDAAYARKNLVQQRAVRDKRALLASEVRSLDTAIANAEKQYQIASDNKTAIHNAEDAEEGRLYAELRAAWEPAFKAFTIEPEKIDLDALKQKAADPTPATPTTVEPAPPAETPVPTQSP